MFLELPVVIYYDDGTTSFDDCDINPVHIVSIKAHPDEAAYCVVSDMAGDVWDVRITRQQLKAKIKAFVKQNILRQYYNDTKDNNC